MKTLLVKPDKSIKINVLEDSQIVVDFTENKNYDCSLELQMQTAGVSAEIYGFYNLKNNQLLKFVTIANHLAPNTKCITQIRGVLHDGTSSDYVGKILITKQAQQTTSFLNHGVLVVGNETTNKSQPILEIEAVDVKASHGATTGRLDETQLYYLMSRGLSKSEATQLIIRGFFEENLSQLEDKNIAENLLEELI